MSWPYRTIQQRFVLDASDVQIEQAEAERPASRRFNVVHQAILFGLAGWAAVAALMAAVLFLAGILSW